MVKTNYWNKMGVKIFLFFFSLLQCKDGRSLVVPHVIAVSGNMDRGLLAYLFNSLQLEKKVINKQRVYQRKVC